MGNLFDLDTFYQQEFEEHALVVKAARETLFKEFETLLEECARCIQNKGKILFFGNGGSAADAQHLATELVVRYRKNRVPIAAIALTTDTSALTAIGNDLGFDHLFSRQIDALGQKGDVAIGISTSGRSENVRKGLWMAQEKGLVACALTGCDGGNLKECATLLLVVPSWTTARIQEMHIMMGQMLCDALEKKLELKTY